MQKLILGGSRRLVHMISLALSGRGSNVLLACGTAAVDQVKNAVEVERTGNIGRCAVCSVRSVLRSRARATVMSCTRVVVISLLLLLKIVVAHEARRRVRAARLVAARQVEVMR